MCTFGAFAEGKKTLNLSRQNAPKFTILRSKTKKFSAASPDPCPRGEGDTPSPHPTPIGAFSASIRPPRKNLTNPALAIV